MLCIIFSLFCTINIVFSLPLLPKINIYVSLNFDSCTELFDEKKTVLNLRSVKKLLQKYQLFFIALKTEVFLPEVFTLRNYTVVWSAYKVYRQIFVLFFLPALSKIFIGKSIILWSAKAGRSNTVYMQMRVENNNKDFAYNH